MGKAETFQDLSLRPPREGQELWRWLYLELRAAILDGRLKPGARMPSTRSLAQQHSLSRGTAVAAFEQLRGEGYIGGHTGAGTFVASVLPEESMDVPPVDPVPGAEPSTAGLSARGLASEKMTVLPASRSLGRAFRSYEPAIDLFPVNLWARVAARVLRRAPRSLYGQGDARGYAPLRRAVAEYVGASRGVRCHADQVLITSGAQQALDLLARLLCDPGDAVWMEDPGYPGASRAFAAAGLRVVPVPVDHDGLNVAEARREEPRARLAYVTPANQFPTCAALSTNRRSELLRWALDAGAWIVEDEYDAEYRYFGPPLPSLASADGAGCVVYVGTFTKMLFNSLRLGFTILPERIVDAAAAARSTMDRHPPTLDQAILAEFILEGHFGLHVRRMRQVYAERMDVLGKAARERLTGLLEVPNAAAGMRTVGWLQNGLSDRDAAERARSHGLELAAMSEFVIRHAAPDALILGFAGSAEGELRRGVEVLASALESIAKRAAVT